MIRYILAMASGFLALSSCAALTTEPIATNHGASLAQSFNRPFQSQGGSFKASYSGEWNTHKGGCGPFCTSWKFHGSGSGTAIGDSREHGVVKGGFGSGDAVMIQTGSSGNSIRVHLNGGFCSPHLNYTVSGGQGIFQKATGSGTIHFSCTGTNRGTYNDNWNGTLYY